MWFSGVSNIGKLIRLYRQLAGFTQISFAFGARGIGTKALTDMARTAHPL
jgi:hypothetical protein